MPDTEVRERPILFSGEMVKAILDGRKTQTRRVIKPQPETPHGVMILGDHVAFDDDDMRDHLFHDVYGMNGTPYGAVYEHGGDRLFVREALACDDNGAYYVADGARLKVPDDYDKVWSRGRLQAIHMPRWASRITLELTDVRAQRINDIAWSDIRAEGFECPEHDFPGGMCCSECQALRGAFRETWDELNERRGFGYATGCWVWAISFRRLEPQ